METSHAAVQERVLGRLLAIAWEHRTRCALILFAQLLMLALNALGLSFAGVAMDVIHHALSPDAIAPRWPLGIRPPVELSTLPLIAGIAVAIALIALVRTGLNVFYGFSVAALVHGEIVPTIRARVYDKLQTLSFRFYDRHDSGGLLNRVTSDVQYLRSFVDGVLIQSLATMLALLVFGSYMFHLHAGLSLACLATTPVIVWFTLRYSQNVLPQYSAMRARLDRFVVGFSEMVHGVQVIKGFAAEPTFVADLEQRNDAVRDSQRSIFRQLSRYTSGVDFLIQVNVAVLLLYGAWLVARDALSVGELMVFAGLLQQFTLQVTTLSTVVNVLQESLIGARRVFEVLDSETEVQSPAHPVALQSIVGAVRFEHVAFSYTDAGPALHDIALEVAPGERIGLFGAAGAGKSTLLSLIPRFYDPTQGRVLIDGIDVRSLSLTQLRQSTAFVFQETFLFSNTIAANIAFGDPNASQERIEQAAKLARAHDFIMALPDGYQSLLGELATNLSGGQRQRLSLARALVRDPRILLLDDPTSALDATTSQEVFAALDTACHGRTTVIATHRPQLLARMDRVVVLERGRIVQQGTHDALLRSDGVYRRAHLDELSAWAEKAS